MSITDILLLGPEELDELSDCYPSCNIEKLTASENLIQRYRVRIEGESEDGYYSLLLDRSIAMSSHNFYSRVKADKEFANRIKKMMSE
ncbi:hypothetical protein [Geomonas anaerohicana]|uniref:Uncharacterized protein n=1 Tax=Geomonas anaerohicana TaxID=2798583 RepID=A0ABS0YC78_9BACT|nr:hypothetical protein [Geomonas anaerohicana]MBJ6749908.1 hypothetical protein [Geomonas anaerohicana]